MFELLDTVGGDARSLLVAGGLAAVAGSLVSYLRVSRLAHFSKDLLASLEADDPVHVMLLWMLGVVALGYGWISLSPEHREVIESGPLVWVALASAVAGMTVTDGLRARKLGTVGPLRRASSLFRDPVGSFGRVFGFGVSGLHELRMSAALYLFDEHHSDAAILRALEPYVPDAERARTPAAFARLSRYAFAFDDLRSHGLHPRDRAEATAVVSDLARMCRALGCTDPATLADLRLLGVSLGLSATEIRILVRAHAGVSGDWQHRRQSFNRSSGGRQRSGPAAGPRQGSSPHDILGVAPGASRSEIKRAWRLLAKRHHPDRYAGTDMTATERAAVEERMRRINAAYDALRR